MAIKKLTREHFDTLVPPRNPALSAVADERAWYADDTESILGVILFDHSDQDWNYVVLGRDEHGVFRWIDGDSSFRGQSEAEQKLSGAITAFADSGETTFLQGDNAEIDRAPLEQVGSPSVAVRKPDLFSPVVPTERLDPNFRALVEYDGYAPARSLMNEIWQEFPDVDGNFLEQFQTTGFDTRTFELYVYAYLIRSGYTVDRTHERPDFIAERGGVRIVIEVTTVNPTRQGDDPFSLRTDSGDELLRTLNERLPIKFGSPLFSKLKMRYWELTQCRGLPLVFFIQSFQQEGSLGFSDSSLGQYLYGMRHFPEWDENGQLIVKHDSPKEHRVGQKVIPSNFFGQPDTENISAVVFSNSGTIVKFNRMAFQAGHRPENIRMHRIGHCYNPDPNAAMPLWFEYDVATPPIAETWGQGLSVMLNPQSLHPLPDKFFVDAAQSYIRGGVFCTDVPRFHPMTSKTMVFRITENPQAPPAHWRRESRP